MKVTIKKTEVAHGNGQITQTNWMLDETINTIENLTDSNVDETVKELTRQKIEYARMVLSQVILFDGVGSGNFRKSATEMDEALMGKISEFGVTPSESAFKRSSTDE